MDCSECEKEAVLFEEDNTGYCLQHAIDWASLEQGKLEFQEKTGISHYEIVSRAMEKKISLEDAQKELLDEADLTK